MRILSTFCHSPSSARTEPISKYAVATSMAFEIWHQSWRYRAAFQSVSLLSTMKSSLPAGWYV
jgi:hypothetical protein